MGMNVCVCESACVYLCVFVSAYSSFSIASCTAIQAKGKPGIYMHVLAYTCMYVHVLYYTIHVLVGACTALAGMC